MRQLIRPFQKKAAYLWSRGVCDCAAAATVIKPISPAQPGTVSEYQHHVLLRLPKPADQTNQSEIWWPPKLERHPAFRAVYDALLEHRDWVDGLVKVTAFEHWKADDAQQNPLQPDAVDVMLFPIGLRYNGVSMDVVKEIVGHCLTTLPIDEPQELCKELEQELSIFVCTHGSRDSRCGLHGVEVAEAFQRVIDKQKLKRVTVYQVSHVGGHKYAGNVLVYGAMSPCDGDWYGSVTKDNAAELLNAIMTTPVSCNGGAEDERLRVFWRGRMDLGKEEQLEMFENPQGHLGVGAEEETDVDDDSSDDSSSSSSSSSSPP